VFEPPAVAGGRICAIAELSRDSLIVTALNDLILGFWKYHERQCGLWMRYGRHPRMLGWIDIDAEASRRALEMLKRLDDKGSIDQLGLGSLRDRVADVILPATSTLMTHARYFFLIPRAFRVLEKECSGRKFVLREMRRRLIDQERIQAERLMALGKPVFTRGLEGSGIIGWDKLQSGRGFVVQLPSSTYWSSLRKLHFMAHVYTADQYLAAISAGILRQSSSGDPTADHERRAHIWDEKIPDLNRDKVCFDLTADESEYLRERYVGSSATKDSFLAAVIADGKPDQRAGRKYVWEHPLCEDKRFSALISQARALSALIVGANRAYNVLLTRHQQSIDLDEVAKKDWTRWYRGTDGSEPSRHDALKTDLKYIRALFPDSAKSAVLTRALLFLEDFCDTLNKCRAGNFNLGAQFSAFSKQELHAKGAGLAKLTTPSRTLHASSDQSTLRKETLQARWAPDFRWETAWSLVCDMHQIPIKPL
jgi:hypothetical protein